MKGVTESMACLAALFVIVSGVAALAQEAPPQPLPAEKIRKKLTIHGKTRIDDDCRLNERSNPKVVEDLKAENAYADALMNPTESLKEKLHNETVGRIKPGIISRSSAAPPSLSPSWPSSAQTIPVAKCCRAKG